MRALAQSTEGVVDALPMSDVKQFLQNADLEDSCMRVGLRTDGEVGWQRRNGPLEPRLGPRGNNFA